MLNVERQDRRSNDLVMRRLTHDPNANSMALGCAVCPLRETC